MKILFFTPRFQPDIGGVEKHTYRVARELEGKVDKIDIITATNKLGLKSTEKMGKLSVHRLFHSQMNSRFETILISVKMWAFIARNFGLIADKDVVHLHDYQTFYWIFPFLVFLRKPLVITFHGFECYPVPRKARIIRKIVEKLSRDNICVGQFILKWYGTQTNNVTLGGVEIPTTNAPIAPENTGLFVGRLSKDTAIIDLIQALKILQEEFNVKLHLHVCGDGPLKPQVEDLAARFNLRVTMHGFVSKPEVYLSKCRYVFSSGYLSILEAMASKKPVFVLYDTPIKKDYFYSVPDAENVMFIASSPKNLAEKVFSSINNQDILQQTVDRAYELAKHHTWQDLANIYFKIYEKLGE